MAAHESSGSQATLEQECDYPHTVSHVPPWDSCSGPSLRPAACLSPGPCLISHLHPAPPSSLLGKPPVSCQLVCPPLLHQGGRLHRAQPSCLGGRCTAKPGTHRCSEKQCWEERRRKNSVGQLVAPVLTKVVSACDSLPQSPGLRVLL